MFEYKTEKVNLIKFPHSANAAEEKEEKIDFSQHDENSWGDMHGNTMRVIFSLLKAGVLQTDANNYASLHEAYEELGKLLHDPHPSADQIAVLKRARHYSCRPVLIHVNGVTEEVQESDYFAAIIDFSKALAGDDEA